MKKISVLFMFAVVAAFAQQPQNYIDVLSNPTITASIENREAVISRIDNGRQAVIDTYTTLTDFTDAVDANCSSSTLTSENFGGGPAGITDCGTTVSSAGDGCFPAGELETGFDTMASNATTVINIPPGAIGNTDSLIGSTTFVEYTIINFSPDVYAVAMDIWENNDPTTEVRVFGTGGALIETFSVTTPTNSQTFFGVIADEPITKIELEGANGSGELFGNFLFGADCLLAVNENLLAKISIYPNPASDILNVKVPSTVTVTGATLFDVLGNNTSVRLVNGQIDIAGLANGIYLLKVETSAGTLTEKVIKK